MGIRCHCAACGTDFGVGKELAGGSVHCVKCGEKITVPAVEKLHRPPKSAAMEQPPAPEPSLAEIIGLDAPASSGSKVARKPESPFVKGKRRAKRWQGWLVGALVGGGSAAVLGIVLAIAWNSSTKPPPTAPPPPSPPKPPALLAIELPENERNNVTISIDGGGGPQRKELPRSGPVTYTLAAGKYRISMDRPDYHAEDSVVLKSGETLSFSPLWVRTHFLPPADYSEPQEAAGGGEPHGQGTADVEK